LGSQCLCHHPSLMLSLHNPQGHLWALKSRVRVSLLAKSPHYTRWAKWPAGRKMEMFFHSPNLVLAAPCSEPTLPLPWGVYFPAFTHSLLLLMKFSYLQNKKENKIIMVGIYWHLLSRQSCEVGASFFPFHRWGNQAPERTRGTDWGLWDSRVGALIQCSISSLHTVFGENWFVSVWPLSSQHHLEFQ
jgi:hypothetical protein